MEPTTLGALFVIGLSVAAALTYNSPLQRGGVSWRRLAQVYGADVELKNCHNQSGIQIGSGAVITDGQVKVGATADGLVLKPHRMKTVVIPWERLSIENHDGDWYVTLRVSTGEVSGLGIRKNIFDSILAALRQTETAERVAHLQPGASTVEATS